MRTLRLLVAVASGLALSAALARAQEDVPMFGDAERAKALRTLTGHEGPVNDALYLPDGTLLTAGADGTLRQWDVREGREIDVLARQDAAFTKLMPGRDGRSVISFAQSGEITVWQLPTPKRPWGPEQAVGAPDSLPGDQGTAWASETEDDQAEWLLLEYARESSPQAVRIYENFNPGSVVEVLGIEAGGAEASLWRASEETPKPESKGLVLEIPVAVERPIKRVKLVVDSPAVAGWNEIDAVGLVDDAGKVQWARRAAASSTFADRARPRMRLAPPPQFQIPPASDRVTHVDDSAEGQQSFGGLGHAVMFERGDEASRLMAIEVFGSRYGTPQPPDEDFRVYVLDEQQKVLHDLKFPYAMFERGAHRWVVLGVDGIEVPEKFGIALFFNAHQTKGVYVGKDQDVSQSHSLVGTPEKGFKPVGETFDWMVRLHLVPEGDASAGIAGLLNGLPVGEPGEYERIPAIWEHAIAAGRRNESDELQRVLNQALPNEGEPLADWQAVVIGGGVINGVSQIGEWPRRRIAELAESNERLRSQWDRVMQLSEDMADDPDIKTGTRYDALRILGCGEWSDTGLQLKAYLGSDVDPELQMGAVSGLADVDEPEATAALIDAFGDFNEENRRLAVAGLLRTERRAQSLEEAIDAGQISRDLLTKDEIGKLDEMTPSEAPGARQGR